jgi:lipoic acid synthetase
VSSPSGLQQISRVPGWIKVRPPRGENYQKIRLLLELYGLHTVCEEARCPNIGECWGGGTATFMLLGDTCTRGCRFCNVKSGNPRGWVDPFEPVKLARALKHLGLRYVVITMVARDDLPDGGASHVAEAIRAVKAENPGLIVEALISDFQGDPSALAKVVDARPHVISHNIETVERLTPLVRDRRAKYRQSLQVLANVKRMDPTIYTKSSIMLGLGETRGEVERALRDLRSVGVDIVTLGQYLRPSSWHLPVAEYIPPERFEEYRQMALAMGFLYVAAGPLVRTSYRAAEFFLANTIIGAGDTRPGDASPL